MLTPIDIHYLVGLLTLVSQPHSVDVELGSMVYDSFAEKNRDVDVLVTYRDPEGTLSALAGVEVKKHTRPLTVEHVEQLFAKFGDMPSLGKKGIVSASGYTAGAVKKAKAHGMDIFEFTDWRRGAKDFDHIDSSCQFTCIHRVLTWIGTPKILYSPDRRPPNIAALLQSNPDITIESDPVIVKKLSDLQSSLTSQALNTLIHDKNFSIPNDTIEVSVNLTFQTTPIIEDKDVKINLCGATVRGVVQWRDMQISTQYKSLYKHGEIKPHVACAVTEMPSGDLYGLTFSQQDRSINFVIVTVSDRTKNKIFKRQLKRNC